MTRFIPLALAALALALAACGGSDGSVSSEELEQRIDEAQEQVGDEIEGLREADSADDLEERADAAAEEIREQADELAELEPPEEGRELRDRLVERYRELADSLEEDVDNIGEDDVSSFLDELEGLDREDLDRMLEDLRDGG